MLARLSNLFASFKAPSVVLVIGDHSWISALHCVPEDGFVEIHSTMSPSQTTFRHGCATETSRQQIATVRLSSADGMSFLQDAVEPKVHKLWADTFAKKPQLEPQAAEAYNQAVSVDVARLADEVLQLAVLEAIREREGQPGLVDVTPLPVYVVHVNRSRLGRISSDKFTSWGD
ncbi:hypothetical protein DAEQUDRAFT_759539 [Daedalea quercina L-15889]|uniref:Uncharacterized protein n=1 Tax=Daedalea quercina L-15889 TaxID=1314783 RepID=A0A165LZZ4_9APHY|nr:hypothetical protein DAEQUDRAFT_759539 [Daedalea quercina L-15889]